MLDAKEIVNWLEMSYKYSNVDENDTLVPQWVVLHAIELLKGPEPVEPLIAEHKIYGSNRICANCTAYLFPAGKYCPGCGREVKWDD